MRLEGAHQPVDRRTREPHGRGELGDRDRARVGHDLQQPHRAIKRLDRRRRDRYAIVQHTDQYSI